MDDLFPLPEFEAYVRGMLAEWHIPGLAIAVVKDGRILLCAGYGQREISQGLPVTPQTIFPIASCTKAFTALAVGLLVEDGKLDWDAPLRDYLPDFRLMDDYASQRITPRDLLCHRSGLPAHDMLWYGSSFNMAEIYRRLRFLEPSCDLRTRFQYQNMMYMVAGLLIERVTGQSWESFVRQRIFIPLGMQRSDFSPTRLQQDADHSHPYLYQQGEIQEIPFPEADGERGRSGAAGAITTCASDMAKWLLLQLEDERPGETSLISPRLLRQLRQPQIFIDDAQEQSNPEREFNSYGLGWSLRMQKGQLLACHDGIADGFSAFVGLLPRRGLGAALLCNADFSMTNFPHPLAAIAYTLFDRLAGLEPTDWDCQEKAAYDAVANYLAGSAPAQAPRPAAGPAHPVEEYLGEYAHPAYGTTSVEKTAHGLVLSINHKISYPLNHCLYDIFEVVDERFNHAEKVSFFADAEGKVSSFAVRMDPSVKPAVFQRI